MDRRTGARFWRLAIMVAARTAQAVSISPAEDTCSSIELMSEKGSSRSPSPELVYSEPRKGAVTRLFGIPPPSRGPKREASYSVTRRHSVSDSSQGTSPRIPLSPSSAGACMIGRRLDLDACGEERLNQGRKAPRRSSRLKASVKESQGNPRRRIA